MTLSQFKQTPLDKILEIAMTLLFLYLGAKWAWKENGGKQVLGGFMLVFASANVLRTANQWSAWEQDVSTWLSGATQGG